MTLREGPRKMERMAMPTSLWFAGNPVCGVVLLGERGDREGLPVPREPALATSGDMMSKRSRHRVSGGQDARSERPATGYG
jgi:hypothetical protein